MKNSDEGSLHLSAPMVVREPTPCALTPGCTGELRPWPVESVRKCKVCEETDDGLTRAGCACGAGCYDFDGGWLGGGTCEPDTEEGSTE